MPRFSGGTTWVGEDSSAPFISMRPAVGFMKPAIMRSVVVLPQPEGPSRETNSPGWSVSETSCTAGVVPKFLPRPISESLVIHVPVAA